MTRLEMLRSWKATIDAYTVTLTEAIPEAMADFKAAPEQMSTRALIDHLAEDERTAQTDIMRVCPIEGEQPKLNPGKRVLESRRVLKEILQFTDTLLRTRSDSDLDRPVNIPGLNATVTVAQIVQAMIEHQVHHRGQLLTYLRLQGITPPRRWQD